MVQTKNTILILKADNLYTAKWHADVAFAAHLNFRRHTGITLSYGKESITSVSRKQIINTKSSIQAEIMGVDEVIGHML